MGSVFARRLHQSMVDRSGGLEDRGDAPVIPGYTAVPLPGGGFVEEPNSMLAGAGAASSPPPPTEIETLVTGLKQAQDVRTYIRQLAR